MPRRRQLRAFDLRNLEGVGLLIGVDEAGRGALAGPVVAAAVEVSREFLESRWVEAHGRRVNDSKQLTAEEREALGVEFDGLARAGRLRLAFGVAEVAEIEAFNILGATKLAMRRALEQLHAPAAFQRVREPDLFSSAEELAAYQPPASARILVDGLPLRGFPYPHLGVVSGDARSFAIAMASIVAKTTRDRLMVRLDESHPGYGFTQHKGYGTTEHREALLRLGRSPQHRESFLRKLMAERGDPAQMDFLAGSTP